MEKLSVNGIELEYTERGTGEAFLLIGTGPIADSFLPLLSAAPLERYRLITYRQRRLAGGVDSPAPVSFAEHAADAAELLRQLGISRAHVAGHSTGAAIALQLTVNRPDVVHSLTLLEPPLLCVPSTQAFFEKAGPALASYSAGDRIAAVAEFLSMVCSLDWATCQQVIEGHLPGGVARAVVDADNFFASYLPSLGAWQFGAEQAASITQPVLSVLGAETEQLFVDGDKQLHSWFPQVEDCQIEGAAHLLHMQRPEPVAQGIAAFLARNPMVANEVIVASAH